MCYLQWMRDEKLGSYAAYPNANTCEYSSLRLLSIKIGLLRGPGWVILKEK